MILKIFELCWWKKAIKLIQSIQKVKHFLFKIVGWRKQGNDSQFNFIIIIVIIIIIIIIPAGEEKKQAVESL